LRKACTGSRSSLRLKILISQQDPKSDYRSNYTFVVLANDVSKFSPTVFEMTDVVGGTWVKSIF